MTFTVISPSVFPATPLDALFVVLNIISWVFSVTPPLNLINIVSLEDRVVILCNNQFYVLYTADNNSVNWRLIEGVQDMGDIEGDSVCKVSGGFIFQSETGIYFSNGIEKKRLFPQVQDIIDESWSKETKWAGMYPNILNYGENLLLSLPMKVTKTYLEENFV